MAGKAPVGIGAAVSMRMPPEVLMGEMVQARTPQSLAGDSSECRDA
jgi:hypothetical protein